MVEDVKRLHRKRQCNPLCELRFLGKCEINLPVRQGANHSIRFVAKPGEVSVSVHRRSLKCGGIDVMHAWNISRGRMLVGQRQRNSRNKVGSLVGLIMPVGKKISIGESVKWRTRIVDGISGEVHQYRQRMTCVTKANAAQLPSSEYFAENPHGAEVRLSGTERKFVHCIDRDVIANVKNARPFVALQTVHILWTAGLAAPHGTVIDRMRPCVTRLKFQTLAEPALQREPQSVIGARPDITLVVDGTERIAAWIVLVQCADAISVNRVEGDRLSAKVYGAPREQPHAPAAEILSRSQEIRRQFMFQAKSPGLHVEIATPFPLQGPRVVGL